MVIHEGTADQPGRGVCPLGFALAAGFGTSVTGCVVAALAAPPYQTTTRLVVLALIVGGFATAIRNLPGAVLTAGMAWSMYLGFLVDQTGELRWHGGSDLLALGVVVAVALAGWGRWPITDLLTARPTPGRVPGPRGRPGPPSTVVRAPGEPAERVRPVHAAAVRSPR
ncbi:hypothetical protein [Actinomadura alba]|uniref:Uncharacterized protein n=1 Tax=Actinomadura alba TaxID=406431 RepID=A0ABR7LWQ8_9ACTN|nr:hypothetical protein [Actinomadura alba]MBC6469221.1 hypothetical protein [Actinomadura alba]